MKDKSPLEFTITQEFIKTQAKRLKEYLKSVDIELQHGNCLHAISRIYGFKDWHVLASIFKAMEANQ